MNRRDHLRRGLLLGIAVCAAGNLTGCVSLSGIVSSVSGSLMRTGSVRCSSAEGRILANAAMDQIRTSYGEDSWDTLLENGTFEDYAAASAEEYVQRILIESAMAQEEGITVDSDVEEKIGNAAAAYISNLASAGHTEVDTEAAEAAFTDYYLAGALEQSYSEVSGVEADEEECRVAEGKQIFIGFDSEESKAAAKKTIKKVAKKYAKGISFEALAAYYGEAADSNITVERGQLDADYEDAVYALEDGEITDPIELDDGYVIFLCVRSNVEDATEKKMEEQKQEKIRDLLDSSIRTYEENHDVSWKDSVWKNISFGEEDSLRAGGFVTVAEEYLS